MAVIYSYPTATPTSSDLVIGTLVSDPSGENPTKTFTIADIIGLVPAAGTGGTVTSVGLTNTDGFLTITNSPITTSGNISIDLFTTGGTPDNTTFYRGDGQWATPPNTTPINYLLSSAANASNIDLTLTPSTGTTSIVKLIPQSPITLTTANNEVTIGSTAITALQAGTFVSVDNTNPAQPQVDLSATGTPSASTYLRGDNSWQPLSGGGSMSSWSLAGDSGTPETVNDGETVTVAGGTGVSTAVTSPNTLTINLDSAVPTSLQAGTTVQDTSTAATNIDISGTGTVTVKAKNVVSNNSDTYTSYGRITNIVSLTAAEYSALSTKDPNTLYIAI